MKAVMFERAVICKLMSVGTDVGVRCRGGCSGGCCCCCMGCRGRCYCCLLPTWALPWVLLLLPLLLP